MTTYRHEVKTIITYEDRFTKGFRNFETKMLSFSRNLETLGWRLSIYVTAPLVALGKTAVDQAVKTSAAWTGVRKVYDGAASDIERVLKPAVSKLTKALGYQKVEVLDILEKIAQMGYTGKSAIDKLRLSLEFARLGTMRLEDSVVGVVAVSKIYRLEGEKLRKTLAMLNMVENTTAATTEDLLTGIIEAGAAAEVTGFGVRELAAMIATLRERGIPAAEAAHALKFSLTRLTAPTEKAVEVARKYNIELVDQRGNFLEAERVIQQLVSSWHNLDKVQKTELLTMLVGRRQVSRFAMLIEDMANKQSTYRKVLEATADETRNMNRYTQELGRALNQPAVQFVRLRVRVEEAAEKVGYVLIPHVQRLLSHIISLAEWFGRLSPETQRLAVSFAGIVAIAGPFLTYSGLMIQSIITLTSSLLYLKPAILGVAAALKFLAAHPAVAVALALGTVVALSFRFLKTSEEIEGVRPFDSARSSAAGLSTEQQKLNNLTREYRLLQESVIDTGYQVSSLEIQQKRLQLELALARRRHIDAVRTYGAGSIWARQAALDLQSAELELKRTETDLRRTRAQLKNETAALATKELELKVQTEKLQKTIFLAAHNRSMHKWVADLNVSCHALNRTLRKTISYTRALTGPGYSVRRGAGGQFLRYQAGGELPYTGLFYGHRGEIVLPRPVADFFKRMGMATGNVVNISFGDVHIRKSSDITDLANEIAKVLGRKTKLAYLGA